MLTSYTYAVNKEVLVVVEKESEGLLVRAEPLEQAERICRSIVEVRAADGTLLLAADPAWAGAINTVLVKKGVKVSELRRAEYRWASDAA